MYVHRTVIVEHWVIPLDDGRMAFDVLSSTVGAALEVSDAEGVPEEAMTWEIRGWPSAYSDPEHLVITLERIVGHG